MLQLKTRSSLSWRGREKKAYQARDVDSSEHPMEGPTWTSASTHGFIGEPQGIFGTRLNSIKTIRLELPDIAESEAVSQHLKHAPFGLLCNWPGLSESLKPSLHNDQNNQNQRHPVS